MQFDLSKTNNRKYVYGAFISVLIGCDFSFHYAHLDFSVLAIT